MTILLVKCRLRTITYSFTVVRVFYCLFLILLVYVSFNNVKKNKMYQI